MILAIAGALEVVWLGRVEAIGRRLAAALRRDQHLPHPRLAELLPALVALRSILSWTGVGAAGGVIAGIVLLGEPRDATRLASLALIVAGIFVQSGR